MWEEILGKLKWYPLCINLNNATLYWRKIDGHSTSLPTHDTWKWCLTTLQGVRIMFNFRLAKTNVDARKQQSCGVASAIRMRTTRSPGQGQPWLRTVMAIPQGWFWVRPACILSFFFSKAVSLPLTSLVVRSCWSSLKFCHIQGNFAEKVAK